MKDNIEERPETIYLQDKKYEGETTWCKDKINDDDVKYIRADLLTKQVEEVLDGFVEGITRKYGEMAFLLEGLEQYKNQLKEEGK